MRKKNKLPYLNWDKVFRAILFHLGIKQQDWITAVPVTYSNTTCMRLFYITVYYSYTLLIPTQYFMLGFTSCSNAATIVM